MAENRQNPRFDYQTDIEIEDPDVDGQIILGQTLDVSEGGMKVATGIEIALGRITRISVEAQTMLVMVIWSRDVPGGWHHGFKRMSADGEEAELWKALIEAIE